MGDDSIKQEWLKPFGRIIRVEESEDYPGLVEVLIAENTWQSGEFRWIGRDIDEGLRSACDALSAMRRVWETRRDLLEQQERERRALPDYQPPDTGELGESTDKLEVIPW